MELTLAIDYGSARVGVAVSAGFLPRPLDVLQHGTLDALIERLLAVARREMATRLVVGLPVNADGTEGAQAASTRHFARQLAAATALPVWLWNEYGSSQAAQESMIAANTSRKARKSRRDALAAATFLQEYIEQNGAGAERVPAAAPEPDLDE